MEQSLKTFLRSTFLTIYLDDAKKICPFPVTGVESEKISDEKAGQLSFEISQKIQTDMTYPGQVKVTVIRETRAVNIAK